LIDRGPRLGLTVLRHGERGPLSGVELGRLLRRTAGRVGAPPGAVTVIWCGDAEIRTLNRSFRGKDRPTDVLSFPDGTVEPAEAPRIGDIVISVPAARRNAVRARHSLRREAAQLVLHGFLHLIGYDHEVDGGEMEALEARLRLEIGAAGGRKTR
jgi:probable rRNA maturation factor